MSIKYFCVFGSNEDLEPHIAGPYSEFAAAKARLHQEFEKDLKHLEVNKEKYHDLFFEDEDRYHVRDPRDDGFIAYGIIKPVNLTPDDPDMLQ